MVNDQEQALVNEKFRQNQAIFRKYTAMYGAIKRQIARAVEPVFLSPLLYQLTWFVKVLALTIIQHLFTRYRVIDKIDIEENMVKMMGPYNPAELPAQLIEQL